MFLAGVSLLYAAGVGLMVWFAAPIVWDALHDYQKRRVEIFLDPDRDPLGAGYHISQAKIALGSGGVNGRGYMQGTQSALDFLPEKHTDFIFTMLGEEWGFAGTVAVVALYAFALVSLAVMALRCRSQFARLLIAGALVALFVYAAINIAMVTGLVPVVGVPLPLVSYGGTSMVSMMIALGLAMSAYVHRDHTFRRRDVHWFW
jgi:rod shape determining protein RodA